LATFSSRLPDPTLAGLPDALRDYRVMLADRPTQFNRTKYVFQAFLRVTVGTRHGLYLDVVDVPKLREVKATGHPFTPAELSALTKTLTQPYAAMCWTMALTGMGLKEYWGRWSVVGDRVEIHGTKTASRERVVPVCGELVRPGSAVSTFRRLFRPAAPGHTPYDLRRSFAHWLELAGIPQTRQDIYQGHGPRTVSDRYRWHAVEPYVGADGARVRAWLREQGAAGLAVVG
jgi:integrase